MKRLRLICAVSAVFLICSCSSAPKGQPFSVDLHSLHYEADSAEAYFKNALSISGSLRMNNIDVYYYPVEDAVCLRFKTLQYSDCQQFWDKNGRDAFISAFTNYREEYEQRRLTVNKNKTTRTQYGTVQGYYVWQRTRFTVRAHGSPKVNLGYQFNDKSAFFTTTQMESRYQDPITNNRDQTSVLTTMYFTRAQAEALAALFNQEYLQSLGKPGLSAETDEYL